MRARIPSALINVEACNEEVLAPVFNYEDGKDKEQRDEVENNLEASKFHLVAGQKKERMRKQNKIFCQQSWRAPHFLHSPHNC